MTYFQIGIVNFPDCCSNEIFTKVSIAVMHRFSYLAKKCHSCSLLSLYLTRKLELKLYLGYSFSINIKQERILTVGCEKLKTI